MGAVWIYKLAGEFSYKSTSLSNIKFSNEWGRIENSTIYIKAGYAWDGCSPKFKIGNKVIGVWDGWNYKDGWPLTYYASLVHDFLCQFKDTVPMTKEQTLLLFREMLDARGWPFTDIYVKAVDMFGPQRFAGDKQ